MAKSSAKPLPRWMSAKRDCREARFVQIGNSLLFHEKFRSLSAGAFKLYICCAMEAAGSINFQIPASKAEQYGIPVYQRTRGGGVHSDRPQRKINPDSK